MMLVEHDVVAELVGQLPLVVIAVEQIAGGLRIDTCVRQIDAQRAGVVVPRRVIGLLGEVIDLHGVQSPSGSFRAGDRRRRGVGEGEHPAGEFLRLLDVRKMAGLLDRLEARAGDQPRNRRGRMSR